MALSGFSRSRIIGNQVEKQQEYKLRPLYLLTTEHQVGVEFCPLARP